MSKLFRKVSALAVCLAITSAMLAGCGGEKKETAVNTGEGQTTSTQKKEEPRKDLELRYFHFWENKGEIDPGKDMVSSVIYEKFGIKFKEIINPTKDPGEKFKLMITSGDIPDIMFLPFAELSGANEYGTQGLFLDITQLKSKYPDLEKLYTPYISRTLTAKDDKIYALPSGAWETAKDVNYDKEGMWIKKSILDKLGISQTDIKTPDDLYNLCMRIKDEIKEYNGKPIVPYGLGPEGWGDSKFFLMYGADWHNLMEDDKSINFLPVHPGAKDGVAMIYRMMKNGLIEKDAFIQKDAQWKEKLAQGRYAIIMHAPSVVYGELNNIFEKDNPGDTYVPISFPWGRQLHKYFRYPDNPKSVTVLSAKVKEPERILEMFDWIASDEGYITTVNGTEGKFYTMQNGKAVLTEEGQQAKKDAKLRESYGLNNWYRFAGFEDTWKKLGGMDEADVRIEEASKIFATYKEKDDGTALFPNPDTTVAPQVPFRNDGWGILFKIWKDAQMKAIYAKSEEEAMKIWDEAVADMQKQAGERMSKEFEEEYQRQLKILLEDKVSQEAAGKLAESAK